MGASKKWLQASRFLTHLLHMDTASVLPLHRDISMMFFLLFCSVNSSSLPPSYILLLCHLLSWHVSIFLSCLQPPSLLKISNSQTALLSSPKLPPSLHPSIPQAACCVGEGRLPLKMSGLAVFLPSSCSIAPSLPAWMGHHHFITEGVQCMVHNLHFHWVVRRQVPQRPWEKHKNWIMKPTGALA